MFISYWLCHHPHFHPNQWLFMYMIASLLYPYYLQGFWYFTRLQSCKIQVNPRNPVKFTKTRKNTVKFGRNLIKYMAVQQFWNLSQLLGVFTCRKLANLCQNFVTETCKQRSETTRRRLCCEKLGTSHDVKGFAIGSFLKRVVVERANDVLC